VIITCSNCIVHAVQIYKILELHRDQKIGTLFEGGVLHLTWEKFTRCNSSASRTLPMTSFVHNTFVGWREGGLGKGCTQVQISDLKTWPVYTSGESTALVIMAERISEPQ